MFGGCCSMPRRETCPQRTPAAGEAWQEGAARPERRASRPLHTVLGRGKDWRTRVEIKLPSRLVHVEELMEVSVGVEDLPLQEGVGFHACHSLYPCY